MLRHELTHASAEAAKARACRCVRVLTDASSQRAFELLRVVVVLLVFALVRFVVVERRDDVILVD